MASPDATDPQGLIFPGSGADMTAFYAHVNDTHLNPHPQYQGATMVPHTTVAQLVPSAPYNNGGTTYADFPGSGVGGPLQVASFVKRLAATKLVVAITVTGYQVTAANHAVELAVRVDGTDYKIAQLYCNELSSHKQVAGAKEITGIAAGTYTIVARDKQDSSGGAFQVDVFDYLTIKVTETF
jgi:hypothetical protein